MKVLLELIVGENGSLPIRSPECILRGLLRLSCAGLACRVCLQGWPTGLRGQRGNQPLPIARREGAQAQGQVKVQGAVGPRARALAFVFAFAFALACLSLG